MALTAGGRVHAGFAAVEAKRNVKPLLMQARRGIQHDLAFNRRAVSRITETAEDTELSYKVGLSLEKGKVIMPFPMDNTALKNPVGPDYISHLEGPTDDEVVAALPGEPFAEGQLDIKLRSPAPLTIVGHMANKYVGYIPTAPACAAGGLEAHPMHVYWSKLEPTALQKIADKSVELLNELYRD